MKELDNIFKNKLGNHEAPVDPASWTAIQSGIGAAGSSAAATSSGAFFVKAIVGLVAAAVVSAGIYLAVDSPQKPQETNSDLPKTEVQAPINEDIVENETTELVDKEPDVQQETRIQRSSLPTEKQVIDPASNQTIAKVEGSQETPTEEKQVLNVSEKTENNNVDTDPVVSHNINRGHDDATRASVSMEKEELSASFYGIQDEYDAMRFELIPEMEQAHAYSWTVDGQYFTDQKLDFTFEHPGVYPVVLTVTGKTGNLEKQTLELQVFEPPVFRAPDIFTPNNDNKNPTLDFEALSKGLSILETQVFSLSGELVFKSDEYSKKWDGNYHNGEPCAEGQYLWKVVYRTDSGEEIQKRGYVTIER